MAALSSVRSKKKKIERTLKPSEKSLFPTLFEVSRKARQKRKPRRLRNEFVCESIKYRLSSSPKGGWVDGAVCACVCDYRGSSHTRSCLLKKHDSLIGLVWTASILEPNSGLYWTRSSELSNHSITFTSASGNQTERAWWHVTKQVWAAGDDDSLLGNPKWLNQKPPVNIACLRIIKLQPLHFNGHLPSRTQTCVEVWQHTNTFARIMKVYKEII